MTGNRADARFPTPVEVRAVEGDQAHVVVVGWHIARSIGVPLAPILEATGLTAARLPGRWLEAEANCYAEHAEDLVLSGITIAPDLPVGWMEPDQ
ncbi:hypothetical protein [Peterkaempfera griseoplana]|uniref:hypothetical protein n=1 Tax=Peterkaempfera griseoplana TaxID=66896 RepID=UPI0006E1F1CC|nr:hypothetical protein [Peterkaempfera griseoplana]